PSLPEPGQAARSLPAGTLLDGEIVIADASGWFAASPWRTWIRWPAPNEPLLCSRSFAAVPALQGQCTAHGIDTTPKPSKTLSPQLCWPCAVVMAACVSSAFQSGS